MSKTITPSQLLGEIGETAARLRFLTIGFQFDVRSRLETGIDGIAEVMRDGKPIRRIPVLTIVANRREEIPDVSTGQPTGEWRYQSSKVSLRPSKVA